MNSKKSFYLKVVKVHPVVEAANGNGSYKKVTFQQMMSEEINPRKTIEKPTALSVTMNLWSAQKRSDGSMTKPHFMYDEVVEGDEWSGDIVKFNTTPYSIETNGTVREARSITVVVFQGEDAIAVANNQLSQRNACVVTIDEDGVSHNTLNLNELRERNAERARGNSNKPEVFKNEGEESRAGG